MPFCILDTETASLQGGVVEIAWIWINKHLEILDQRCYRVNPERPIQPDASAIHGIYDHDVADKPTLAQITAGFTRPIDMIGHNIGFDIRMIKPYIQPNRKLCTLALARQYVQGTTNQKLETLQKELSLPVQQSHSALGDIHTCLDLLKTVLLPASGTDLEGLFLRAEQPRMLARMPFGKHKDMLMLDVPSGYRRWLLTQELDMDLKYTLEKLENT